jgi:hypothetical protein
MPRWDMTLDFLIKMTPKVHLSWSCKSQ